MTTDQNHPESDQDLPEDDELVEQEITQPSPYDDGDGVDQDDTPPEVDQ